MRTCVKQDSSISLIVFRTNFLCHSDGLKRVGIGSFLDEKGGINQLCGFVFSVLNHALSHSHEDAIFSKEGVCSYQWLDRPRTQS